MSRVSQSSSNIQLVAQVRAGFVTQGTTLHAWCQSYGVDYSNAFKALSGKWSGRKAAELTERIVKASKAKVTC
jgi:hypothetical protein